MKEEKNNNRTNIQTLFSSRYFFHHVNDFNLIKVERIDFELIYLPDLTQQENSNQ